ncbi:MAG: hypothetical protein QF441_15580 [Bacteriovoracaceae bacterium]|jgi:Zn-dependent protease with chaperone function|nr:hypothetical protein [Bacteriovoracaceae bacterium]
MKRYIMKIGLESKLDFKKIKNKIRALGVKRSEIDYLESNKRNVGLKLKRHSKGPMLALGFLPIGFIVGGIVYYLKLFMQASVSWSEILQKTSLNELFIEVSLFGFLFLILGYFIGRKYLVHSVLFTDDDKDSDTILMAININESLIKPIKEELKHHEIISLNIIDRKQEVEVGLRSQ